MPWRRERPPIPVFWPGESHGLDSPWGRKESDRTDWLSLSLHLIFISGWLQVNRNISTNKNTFPHPAPRAGRPSPFSASLQSSEREHPELSLPYRPRFPSVVAGPAGGVLEGVFLPLRAGSQLLTWLLEISVHQEVHLVTGNAHLSLTSWGWGLYEAAATTLCQKRREEKAERRFRHCLRVPPRPRFFRKTIDTCNTQEVTNARFLPYVLVT